MKQPIRYAISDLQYVLQHAQSYGTRLGDDPNFWHSLERRLESGMESIREAIEDARRNAAEAAEARGRQPQAIRAPEAVAA